MIPAVLPMHNTCGTCTGPVPMTVEEAEAQAEAAEAQAEAEGLTLQR